MTGVVIVAVLAVVVFSARAFVYVFEHGRASAIIVTRNTGGRYGQGENEYCDI